MAYRVQAKYIVAARDLVLLGVAIGSHAVVLLRAATGRQPGLGSIK